MARLAYDILIIGDLRLPGATGRAIAEEIRAQAAAGYRTALLQLKSPLLVRPHPIHPLIRAAIDRELADWLDPEVSVEARLAIAHHPGAFTHLATRTPKVEAGCKLLVVNHPLLDAGGRPYFPVRKVAWSVQELLGDGVLLAPGGPQIRAQLAQSGWPEGVLDRDWPPVVELGALEVEARSWRQNRTVLGRHGPYDVLAWPEDPKELGAAYPNGPATEVSILGDAKELRRELGPPAEGWSIVDPAGLTAREFLSRINVFVCFTARRTVQPTRLEVIEALASGTPAVLPAHFRPTFEETAVYVPPAGVADAIDQLRDEGGAREERVEHGREVVRRRFSHEAHAARVRALIGAPSAERPLALRRERRPARRVLFFSSNGVGMGHLTRLLAIARRCSSAIVPVFLTMSQAARVVEEFGYLVEFTAYHSYLDLDVERWNPALRAQLNEMIAFYDARAVLFDGNVPYRGLVDARSDNPALPFMWCRRGMWRPDAGRIGLERERSFDVVIEPRDLAEPHDRGPTGYFTARTFRVDPVLLLDPDELPGRQAARAELGLDPEAPALLIQLGSRNNYDYGQLFRIALDHADKRGVQVAVAEWLMSDIETERLPGHMIHLRSFPLSRYVKAFDGAITAVGYNSFHELIAYGVPSIFVPNEHPSMDDQLMRALFAERRGLGLCVRTTEPYQLRAAINRLLEPDEAARIARRCRAAAPANGAGAAARMLEEAVLGLRASEPLGYEAELLRLA